ncbi:helix-turn-helix transcriptional regulator [Phocaeicola plebeius]
MKTISQKLRKLRDAKGYSQEYVAENMGVSPSCIFRRIPVQHFR